MTESVVPENKFTEGIHKFSTEIFPALFPASLVSLVFMQIISESNPPNISDLDKFFSTIEHFAFLTFAFGLLNGFNKASKLSRHERPKTILELRILTVLSTILMIVLPFIFQLGSESIRQPFQMGNIEIPFPATTALAYIMGFFGLFATSLFYEKIQKLITKKNQS